MQGLRERFRIFVPLLAAAYLGFYGFGLVMGVISFTTPPWATIGAAICVVGLIVYNIARRLGAEPVDPHGKLGRSARAQREHRGF